MSLCEHEVHTTTQTLTALFWLVLNFCDMLTSTCNTWIDLWPTWLDTPTVFYCPCMLAERWNTMSLKYDAYKLHLKNGILNYFGGKFGNFLYFSLQSLSDLFRIFFSFANFKNHLNKNDLLTFLAIVFLDFPLEIFLSFSWIFRNEVGTTNHFVESMTYFNFPIFLKTKILFYNFFPKRKIFRKEIEKFQACQFFFFTNQNVFSRLVMILDFACFHSACTVVLQKGRIAVGLCVLFTWMHCKSFKMEMWISRLL